MRLLGEGPCCHAEHLVLLDHGARLEVEALQDAIFEVEFEVVHDGQHLVAWRLLWIFQFEPCQQTVEAPLGEQLLEDGEWVSRRRRHFRGRSHGAAAARPNTRAALPRRALRRALPYDAAAWEPVWKDFGPHRQAPWEEI